MIGRGRGTQRGDSIIDVVLRQRHDVHIAFDNQQTRWFGVVLLRFIQAI